MRHSLFFAFLAVVILAGCNTMFNDSYQKITVYTPGVENADCYLETEFNKYRILAPGIAEVDRSRHPLMVTCQKVGYITGSRTLKSRIRMVPSQLNLLNGVIPGVAYDVASNSVYDYPDTVTIKMQRSPKGASFFPEETPYEMGKKTEDTATLRAELKEAIKKEETSKKTDGEVSDVPQKDKANKTFSDSLRK